MLWQGAYNMLSLGVGQKAQRAEPFEFSYIIFINAIAREKQLQAENSNTRY